MRRSEKKNLEDFRVLIVDDDSGIIDSLSIIMKRNGYDFKGINNPIEAIEEIKSQHFDLLILDFLMEPIHGDKVVERIREFNRELYILLLTGHKDLAPPLETIKALEIQGYCEKSDKFDQLLLLIESAIKSISQMRTIKKFQDGLNKILHAVPKIYQLQSIGHILEEILVELLPFVNSENAFIIVDDVMQITENNKSIFRGIGEYRTDIDDFMEMLGHDFIEKMGYARMAKKVIALENGIILPLINELAQTIGIMYVESTDFEEGGKLLEIYASQAASAVNNAFLHSLVNIKNEELNKTYEELKETYVDTIEALRLAVDAKDVYTRGHSDRVAYYSVKIGEVFGLDQKDLEKLKAGGVFHDVGKIGTADDILLKTMKLDDREYNEIKRHPIKGAHILSAISIFRDVVPLVKYHHEKYDGTGYPEGLKGEDIPFLARIVSVADAFDAMTSDRLYRSKLNLEEAKNQLIKGSGIQFDPKVVEVFIKLLEEFEKMKEEVAYTYEEA